MEDRRIGAGAKCGRVVGRAFDSEGLLGSISGVGAHGETYVRRRKLLYFMGHLGA